MRINASILHMTLHANRHEELSGIVTLIKNKVDIRNDHLTIDKCEFLGFFVFYFFIFILHCGFETFPGAGSIDQAS